MTIDSLISSVQKCTISELNYTPIYYLNFIYYFKRPVNDFNSVLYRLIAIIMDIANRRLFKPVSTTSKDEKTSIVFNVDFVIKS